MYGWSTTPEEYNHIRKLIVEAPFLQKVEVRLKNGGTVTGIAAGSNSSNDVGENIRKGIGPVITSIFGEITLLLDSGHKLVLNALEIESIAKVTTS
ncbi:hypothetical protein EN759_00445 [Mesorhizobium sp. M00.F.Ca.ET.038.03.1.1]|nr:hypothetical protein EN759_00445 [Mesorhizobium sp. M00.F.Ca.ET.038.03.1.1]TIW04532.1 MAG: hypothetical protein E5V77_00165 [Mesorhizobium sp.]